MLLIYRLIINSIYFFLYPLSINKAKNGDPKSSGRLGYLDNVTTSDIWFHAASMGEVKVIGYLIEYLQKQAPQLKLHLTAMTDTGYNAANKLYQNINVTYFPYDQKSAIKRTIMTIKPKLIVIAETEIWPNLITEASANNIPMIMINSRMSPKAFGRYVLIKKTMSRLLSRYDRFFFKSELDFKRYQNFDVDQSKAEIVGDMKFDAPVVRSAPDEIKKLRIECGFEVDDFVFVCGSTRQGEEEQLLDCYLNLKSEHPNLRLVLVPRHLERIEEIKNLLEGKRISYRLYDSSDRNGEILLVNQMGLLIKLYEIADLAFVGGTLADIGGHNILEPVWAGCPVVYGPSLTNVQEAAEYIEKNKFGQKVNDSGQLLFLVRKVISKEVTFKPKNENNLENSATARVADYIIKKIRK